MFSKIDRREADALGRDSRQLLFRTCAIHGKEIARQFRFAVVAELFTSRISTVNGTSSVREQLNTR